MSAPSAHLFQSVGESSRPGGKSSAATITLLVVMILVLGLAIMYLFTRIRKQDQILDQVRRENQQQLQDQDVVQVVRHYVTSPQYQTHLVKTITPVVESLSLHYVQQYYPLVMQAYSAASQPVCSGGVCEFPEVTPVEQPAPVQHSDPAPSNQSEVPVQQPDPVQQIEPPLQSEPAPDPIALTTVIPNVADASPPVILDAEDPPSPPTSSSGKKRKKASKKPSKK